MVLYLVGENLDKTRAHYRADTGKIVQLMRGIYVDSADDTDTVVLRHAVRIARYLYPRAYLSAASAVLLAPTRDGRLFISGPRSQRTRIRALEIIQNVAPAHPSTATAVIKDGLGEFRANVSSVRQRFLEAFRLRSEHAVSLDDSKRADIAQRLVEEYGDPKAAADALWSLARENEWYREGEQAERYLLKQPATAIRNEATLNFTVAWHGQPIGELNHDGFEWRWRSVQRFDLPLVRQTVPGRLPPFILSLLPEGWLERVLNDPDERTLLRSGKRYMSNITIAEQSEDIAALPSDVLVAKLADHSRSGVFLGTYAGPGRGDIERDFEKNLARLFSRADMPRLSGIQIKVPMFLSGEGALQPSTGEPFTHILKPAGTSGIQALPLIEFLALSLGRYTGFTVPETLLVPMPDGLPPALIVERFDIRTSPDDTRRLALEDLCSVLNLPPDAKYDGTIERIMRAMRPLSTAPRDDLRTILQRALFAWLIADGDMHLKNLALLKTAEPSASTFDSVRLAPLYDAVTTRVFPQFENDHMALKLAGKDDRLKRADFQKLAATGGLSAADAQDAIDSILRGFGAGLDAVSLPDLPNIGDDDASKARQMLALCRERLEQFV
ncbi:MAG: HipA domain-containing protein [Gammaproteobacteria bacterium]|nr:HipA domain-containing protein [Gammaproteobacteria bacterium]